MTTAPALFDSRSALIRPALAEQALEGLVPASAYRPLTAWRGLRPACDVFAAPEPDAPRISQLLFGEAFDVLDGAHRRLWGRCRRDGVTGWISEADLEPVPSSGAPLASHRVAAPDGALPLNALVVEPGLGLGTLAPIGEFATDPVAVAESLIGVRHAPGGRSSFETDCAGLVQQALLACGRAGPRYADQQAELGVAVARDQARRGDLAIWLHPRGGPGWTGHSALMLDQDHVIHASGAHGAVVVEPFGPADARCRADGFSPPLFRRPGV